MSRGASWQLAAPTSSWCSWKPGVLGERRPSAAEVTRSTAAQQVTGCFGLPHAAILAAPPPCSYCCCCRGGCSCRRRRRALQLLQP